MNRTDPDIAATEPTVEEVNLHMAYVEQQNLDGQSQTVIHANKRKAVFDQNVLKKHPKEIIFKQGELVQVHRTELNFTHSTTWKLTPQWSPPFQITLCIRNAYKLETLNGSTAKGEYSARHLQCFHAREGTQLAADQERYMVKHKAERQPGDDDEGDKAECSDTEDPGVQDEDNEDEQKIEDDATW